MRGLILGLMLALSPSLAWAGDARMLFMAAQTQFPTATSSTVYDFEDATTQGWTGAFTATATAHSGVFGITGVSGYTEQAITPVQGTLNFWYRSNASGAVKVNGSTVLSLPSTSLAWTEQSVSIAGSIIRFEVTGGTMSLDDISVPIP
jgi:hypothetical protein